VSGLKRHLDRSAGSLLALAGAFALVWLTGILPALEIAHSGDPTHRCELCQLGQTAALKPSRGVSFSPPVQVTSLAAATPVKAARQAVISWQSPRSPPA
jgi:hypothetical protein